MPTLWFFATRPRSLTRSSSADPGSRFFEPPIDWMKVGIIPGFQWHPFALNSLLDASCVLFLFPLVTHWGARSKAGSGMINLSSFSCHHSDPLYTAHHPFVYVLRGYSWIWHPSLSVKITWIFVLIPFVILVAWLALNYHDEPVRAWLTCPHGNKRPTVALAERPGEA